MTKLTKLSTYDDPDEMAVKACQWHETNDGPPVSHRDALIHVGMRDPLQLYVAVGVMRNLTAPEGEFFHLTETKKYIETSAKAAEERAVPRGRSLARMGDRKLKAVDDTNAKIDSYKWLPDDIRRHLHGLSSAIVNGAARQQNAERTFDLIEWEKEIAAKLNLLVMELSKDGEKNKAEIASLRDEVKFLRDLVRNQKPAGVLVPA